MSASPNFPDLPNTWTEEIKGVSRIWKSHSPTSKKLLIVHGFGENSNRYRHAPHYLQNHFSQITGVDLPGHGMSPEKRGDCQSFADFTNRVLENLEPDTHILGHSFGGLVVLKLLKDGKLAQQKSVVVSAPLLRLAQPAPFIKALAGRLIAPLLPHLQLENEVDPAVVSRDLSVIEAYKAEPLNHSKITPRTFVEMTRTMDEILNWTGSITQKFAMLLPMGDRLVHAQANFQFFQKLEIEKPGSKKLIGLPGFSHESMNDIGKGVAFNALEEFYS